MSRIFVSHSAEDAPMARCLVDLLVDGVGASRPDVFCSSVAGQIQPGEDFQDEVRRHLVESSLVVAIATEAFVSSRFCMFEIGAAWALKKHIIPVIVPPASPAGLAQIISTRQAVTVDRADDLSAMRDAIAAKLRLTPTPTAVWDAKRRLFLERAAGLLAQSSNWVYALVSVRPEVVHKVIGAFSLRRIPDPMNAVKATGRAYWVLADSVRLRGEWISSPSLAQRSTMEFRYTMSSPPDGEALALTKSQTHEGFIHLEERTEFHPLRGTACFAGYVQDFGDWRDNTPAMYAEPVATPWEDLLAEVESGGRELFEKLSKRLGAR